MLCLAHVLISDTMKASQLPGKKKLTDAERAELAKKLDDELEEFIEQMAEKKKSERTENSEPKKPFDFDEWCKEIEQHPCFMTDKSDISKCLSGKYGDTVAAMQAMKYDDEEEDKEYTAEKNKNEGNKHYGNKKYRWAIECYTTGIKANCLNHKLNGILYSNRAAANKKLGNYRSAIKDSIQARRFDPLNLKATIHAVESMLSLGYGKEAVDLIEESKRKFAFVKETEGEDVVDNETKLLDSLTSLADKAQEVFKNQRKHKKQRDEKDRLEFIEKSKLLTALKLRKLNLNPRVPYDHPDLFDYSLLRISLPQVSHEHEVVQLDWDGNLVWTIMLQYPEVNYSDVITEVNEKCQLGELMENVLAEQAPFDPEHIYRPSTVRYFIASEYDEFLIEIKQNMTFEEILSYPHFQIKSGLPVIMIFSADYIKNKMNKSGSNGDFDHYIFN